MRYFAILKDSFREATDSKILYVMLGLAGLLMLFLSSLSFRPLTMQEYVEGFAKQLNFVFRLQAAQSGRGEEISLAIENFRQTNDAAEPWQGDYEFDYALRFPDVITAQSFGLMMGNTLSETLPAAFWWLDHIQVKKTEAKDLREIRWHVASRGTKIDSLRSWPHEPTLFFGAFPLSWFRDSLSYRVYWVENYLVNTIGGWVAILIGVIVTSSFIPNMLRKGTIDLLLARPVRRSSLLIVKYIGGLTFVFLLGAVVITGIWIILGLRSGIWTYGFLLTVFVLTFFFAILYSVSTLTAVLTRSTVVCILVTCAVWFVLWLIGLLYSFDRPALLDAEAIRPRAGRPADAETRLPPWLSKTVGATRAVLPRTGDLEALTTALLSRELLSEAERKQRGLLLDANFSWAECLGVSCAFIAVMLGLSCWRFAKMSF